jgi:CubicO group peptidase (beta-lactamase class C family)
MQQALNQIDALAARVLDSGATPGIALAVSDREQTLEVRCYGHADPKLGTPVTPATLFEIGSISKSFTAICLVREWERGRLDLQAPVAAVLPWFPVPDVSFHHLLSHTGGLPCGTGEPPGAPLEVLALSGAARSPAGERFWYSNVGYGTLGQALAQITGEPHWQTYRSAILEPLGLRSTEPVITTELRPRLAVGHEPMYDERPYRVGDPLVPATWTEYREADGSVASTAADLVSYGRMILNHGRGVLSERGFARLVESVVVDPNDGDQYGYGLTLGERDGHLWIGHSGGMIGYHSQLWCDMDAGLAVAVLVNGKGGSDPMADFALRALAGQSPPPPDLDELSDAAVEFDPEPAEQWREICGLYRSHNPWSTAIVVGTVAGRPTALHWGESQPLTRLEDGGFRWGDEWSPERMRFDTVMAGRAMRLWLGAAAYYRIAGSR